MKKKKTMFRSMLCGVSILIIATVLIYDLLIASNTWKNENERILETSEQLSVKLENALSRYIEQMDATISSIHYELMNDTKGYVYKLFSDADYASNAQRVAVNYYMSSFFAKLQLMQPDLVAAYTYVDANKHHYWSKYGHLSSNYSPANTRWLQTTLALAGQTYTRINYLPEGSTYQQPVIGFSRKLINSSNVEIGGDSVILLEYSISMIEDIVSNYIADEGDQLLLVDADGEIIYQYGGEHSASGQIDEALLDAGDGRAQIAKINGERVCVGVGSRPVQNLRVVVLSDYDRLTDSFRYYLVSSAALALLMIFLAMIPAYIYVHRLCREVEKLETGMLRLCGGNFSIRLSSKRSDEIGSLVSSFNEMAERTQQLIRRQYQQELERREAEYKYLEAQINPHFIFNSLQIISSMAIVNGIPSIESVSNSLARLLSYSLSSGSKLIPVSEELENVRQYMIIQQTRFRDWLEYQVDVSPEVCACKIIRMVLQPIVENAISHALEPRGGKGTIRIHGFRRGNGCVLLVCDDGVGMNAAQLRELKSFISGDDSAQVRVKGNGVGLRNINNRLKLYYGDEFGLKIESEPGVGTTVAVQISLQEDGEETCCE